MIGQADAGLRRGDFLLHAHTVNIVTEAHVLLLGSTIAKKLNLAGLLVADTNGKSIPTNTESGTKRTVRATASATAVAAIRPDVHKRAEPAEHDVGFLGVKAVADPVGHAHRNTPGRAVSHVGSDDQSLVGGDEMVWILGIQVSRSRLRLLFLRLHLGNLGDLAAFFKNTHLMNRPV